MTVGMHRETGGSEDPPVSYLNLTERRSYFRSASEISFSGVTPSASPWKFTTTR